MSERRNIVSLAAINAFRVSLIQEYPNGVPMMFHFRENALLILAPQRERIQEELVTGDIVRARQLLIVKFAHDERVPVPQIFPPEIRTNVELIRLGDSITVPMSIKEDNDIRTFLAKDRIDRALEQTPADDRDEVKHFPAVVWQRKEDEWVELNTVNGLVVLQYHVSNRMYEKMYGYSAIVLIGPRNENDSIAAQRLLTIQSSTDYSTSRRYRIPFLIREGREVW